MRDDVVSQRLNFGNTFISYSWESKIAMFFNFPVSRTRPKKLCDLNHMQVRLDCIIDIHDRTSSKIDTASASTTQGFQ